MMNNKWWWLALIIAICVVIVLACSPRDGQQNIVISDSQTNGVEVSGTGEVNVSPDKAIITVGVKTQKTEASDAQNSNSQIMNNVLNAVKSKGVDENTIKTVNYDVNPEYNEAYTKIASFSVTNVIMFETTDVSKAGEILQAAGDAGANTNFNISFGLQDEKTAYNNALKLAVEDAKGKAQTIVDAAGKGLGDLLSIQESNYSSTYSSNAMYDTEGLASGNSVPIESGELTVVANVSVVYSVR